MSAWDRLPQWYKDLCIECGKNDKLSPQNKRVRAAVDRHIAEEKRRKAAPAIIADPLVKQS